MGEAAAQLLAYISETLWGGSADLSNDSLTARIQFSEDLVLSPGEPVDLELRALFAASRGSVRFGIDETDVGVVQPESEFLAVSVQAAEAQSFPLWTLAGSFSPANLEESYSNFPNPFAAGREQTTFAYYLRNDARVTLRIWTARGDEVRTVLDGAVRPAGLHQDDRWDGRNGRGHAVFNGVYLAEIEVRYDDGGRDRLLRKVAVLR